MLATLGLALLAAVPALAVEWHGLAYRTASGQQITSFSGDMTVPPLPKAAVYYLWPGLQDGTGVFQPVLDGRKGSWYIGTGWCCSNPSLPWGGGFGVHEGEVVHFNMTLNTAEDKWDTELSVAASNKTATSSFALGELQVVHRSSAFGIASWIGLTPS